MTPSAVMPSAASRKPGFIRHFNWFAIALLVLLYLLIACWLMASPQLWPVAPFSEFILQHPALIRLFTAIIAAFCALFFFWPREGRHLVGRWNDYVGLAFATFCVQYTLRLVENQLEGVVTEVTLHHIHSAFNSVIVLCSALNNLLFLAAARILLNKNKRVDVVEPPEGGGILTRYKYRLINAYKEFLVIIPKWTWVAALLSLITILDSWPGFSWARFPDGLFSAYCLCLFGYATALNLNYRRRSVLAALALLVSVAYGTGQLVYAINPIIAGAADSGRRSLFPLPWRAEIGANVRELVDTEDGALESGAAGGGASQPPAEPAVLAARFLDNAVFAALLPMKFLLFVPAFFLYLLSIISVNDFRRALSETTSRRKDYLSADGVVAAIGESLGVDRVVLFIRLPGVLKARGTEDERVLPLTWDADAAPEGRKRRESPFPLGSNPLLVRLMKTEGEEVLVTSESPEYEPRGLTTEGPSPHVLLLAPVKFHGGVIGALQAEFRERGKFNHTTLQKLRLMAELVAPPVQDFRSLAAADQVGFRFTRLQVNHPKDSFADATARMVGVLHDVLSPQATRLDIEIGFFSLKHVYPEGGDCSTMLEQQVAGYDVNDDEIEIVGDTMVVKSQTLFRPREGDRKDSPNTLQLGSLIMAIPAEKDEFCSPTVAAYYLNRRTVASLTADGVFDAARSSLGNVIKDLSVAFSKETLDREEWFEALAEAAGKAGLLWIAAPDADADGDESQGEPEPIELLPGPAGEEQATLLAQPLSRVLPNPHNAPTRHVVRLRLPKTKQQLYFGVARPTFGPELDFESPWRVFLLDLADVADEMLEGIQRRQKAEADKLREAQYQGVITIAVTTGTLMHQLLNMIKDQLSATEDLEEELNDNGAGLNPRSADLLRTMKRSAERMRELTGAFKSVTKMEGRRPCSVREAAEQAARLFQISLKQRKIEFRNNLPPELEADVPFHVVAFALANLIGNAKDAIRAIGVIEIEAEDKDKFILCHVTNSGPAEIPRDIRETLFEFGKTTKDKDGHNGWGLYFVEKALKENGGAIALAYSNPAATRFTVRLPKQG
ncbi:MAG TPA: ATP-binding protein [Pyrinomonadaceae bacterium]